MPFASKAQQGFMFATMPKTAEKWAKHTPDMKHLPQHVEEINTPALSENWDHPGCEDTIGKIFIVLKPSPESSPEDLVHQTHAFGVGQFEPQGVHGVYNDQGEANLVAEAAITDLHKHLTKVEKKKDHILGEIDSHISRLQKEINGHMKEATEKPEESEMHHHLAEKKMYTIKALRDKHKEVKATKKEIKPLEEKKPKK